MLTEAYTIESEWSPVNESAIRKVLSEKMEALFLLSKNKLFVKSTETDNSLSDCCEIEVEALED